MQTERDLNRPNAIRVGTSSSISSEAADEYLSSVREDRSDGASDRSLQPIALNVARDRFALAASVLARLQENAEDSRRSNSAYVSDNTRQTVARDHLSVMQQVLQSTFASTPRRVTEYPFGTHGYESSSGNDQLNQKLSCTCVRNVHPRQSHHRGDYSVRHQNQVSNLSDTCKKQLRSFSSSNTMTPSSPMLNVPSSRGLYLSRSSVDSAGPSTHLDWNRLDWSSQGQMPLCDYRSIDWTMDSSLLSEANDGQWVGLGLPSIWKNNSRNGDVMTEFSEGLMAGCNMLVGSLPLEWTSPFGGRDIFYAPRQLAISFSLRQEMM